MADSRKTPETYEFYGLRLWYRTVCRDGTVRRIIISVRELPQHSAGKIGKIILEREYAVNVSQTIGRDDGLPDALLQDLVKRALFRRGFLQALFDCRPQLLNDQLLWGLAGPYALDSLRRLRIISQKRQRIFEKAMDQLVALWGERPVADIVPAACAADLLSLPVSTADACLTLLRHLFQGALANVAADPDVWCRYHLRRKGRYSPAHQARLVCDIPIMTDQQCCEVIALCRDKAADDHRYLAALLLLLTPLSPEELAALRWDDIQPLAGHPPFGVIRVHSELLPAESKLFAQCRKRKVRNAIHEITDPWQPRILPAGRLLFSLLAAEKAKAQNGAYLLSDPRNSKRHLSAAALEDWLNATFGGAVCGRETSHSVADHFHCSMEYHLVHSGLREEELRYQSGNAPAHTDGRYYVDFSAASELAGMAAVQDVWMDRIGHHLPVVSDPSKAGMVLLPSPAGACGRADLTIRIPPGCKKEISIYLAAAHGCSAAVTIQGGPPHDN